MKPGRAYKADEIKTIKILTGPKNDEMTSRAGHPFGIWGGVVTTTDGDEFFIRMVAVEKPTPEQVAAKFLLYPDEFEKVIGGQLPDLFL